VNLDQVRLGALFVPTTALWTGSVSSWDGDTFTLTVSTSTGALSDVSAGLAVVWEGQYIRIRAVDAGAGTLTLAETGAGIESGDPVGVYAPRLPFPRYQYIDSDGTVYKDRDVAWTSAAATLPPRAWIWVENPSGDGGYSEAIWVPVGETRTVNALASLVMSAEATTGVLTYQWASDADATIAAPTSSETTVSWSSAGFRYLKLTVTDDQSVSTVRYIPVWVGNANLVDARALSLDWDAARGWRAQVQLDSLTTYLRGAPVAIVDLETADVVTLGWHYPGAWRQDFEVTDVEFELRGAFGYADAIYAYPFIIEDTGSPSEWAHVSELTLERAVWYLLYWHSTLPQLANVGPGTAPDNRRIAGQEFTAGTLADQLTELNEAAFRYVTGYRSGGFTLYEHPLYMTETEFTGLTSIDLSAQTALGETLEIEQAQPTVAEARLSGVYYGVGDAQFKPIIARGPTHPLPWGNTEEVTNLAPTSQAEILQWAARYIALRNTADRYTVRPHTLDVQPADGRVVDLPDGVRIALEEVHLTYNVDALAWDAEVVGRTFGSDVSVAVEPPPPAIEPPEPPAPPPAPPQPPIPPATEWGDGNIVAFTYEKSDGSPAVYLTQNFLDANPTWIDISGNLAALGAGSPWFINFAQGGENGTGLYLTTDDQLFYCSDPLNAGVWGEINPPVGYHFDNSRLGNRPRVMASPAANGEMLCNIFEETGTWRYRWAWVFTGQGETVNLFFTGYMGSSSEWASDLHWNPNGDEILGLTFTPADVMAHGHLVQMSKNASIDRPADHAGYDSFLETYHVCDGETRNTNVPSWAYNKGVLAFTGIGLIVATGNDIGTVGPNVCNDIQWVDSDSNNSYGPDSSLQSSTKMHRIGTHVLLDGVAIMRSVSSGNVYYTQEGFAGATSMATYPAVSSTSLSYHWVLIPVDGQPLGATFMIPSGTYTNGYVYAFDLAAGAWTQKNGNMGLTGWAEANNAAGAHLMTSFWGKRAVEL
jgi:hypothetical protein